MTAVFKSGLIAIENPRILSCATRTGTAGKYKPYTLVSSQNGHIIRATSASSEYATTGTNVFLAQRPSIGDQQSIGACTAFATKGAVWISMLLAGYTDYKPASEKHLYLLCRDDQGQANEDSGSDTQHCLFAYQTIGVCREEVFPWTNSIVDSSGNVERPGIDALRNAAENRIPNMDWNLLGSLNSIEQQLRNGVGCPCIFGSEVDSTIQSYTEGRILKAPNESDIIGGHEMCVTGAIYKWSNLPTDIFGSNPSRPSGYSDGTRLWLISNSWGTGYGYNGYLLANDAFLGNSSAYGSFAALMIPSKPSK